MVLLVKWNAEKCIQIVVAKPAGKDIAWKNYA
jgi:hypothetical protein